MVIRQPQPEEPSEQLTLFKCGKYHYQVLGTHLALHPLNLWRFYNNRAGVERIIRELMSDYPLGKIPTRHVFATEAYFHLLLCAYNLVNWFKRLCLPAEFQTATLQTLRNRILSMPARLLRRGNRPSPGHADQWTSGGGLEIRLAPDRETQAVNRAFFTPDLG